MIIHNPTAYAIYGLPPSYAEASWDNLEVSQDECTRLTNAFKSPIPSTIFVQGNCAPLVQQLIEQKVKVRGIDFTKRQMAAFEDHDNPDAEVVLIWGVNRYSGKAEVSQNLLLNLIEYYRSKNVMVIVQSSESSIFLRDNYGFTTNNKLKLLLKAEVKWI